MGGESTNTGGQSQKTKAMSGRPIHLMAVSSPRKNFEKTIALNNAGAVLMEQDDYSSAVKILERAVFSFKKAYRTHRDSLPSNRVQQRHFASVDELFSWQNRRALSRGCYSVNGTDETDDVDASPPSVYSNPIHLPNDFPVTRESCGFLSTAIALNLAMSHHLVALLAQSRQSDSHPVVNVKERKRIRDHLGSAGRLYEFTIRLESTRARQCQRQQAEEEADVATVESTSPLQPMNTEGVATANTLALPNLSTATTNSSTVPTLFVSPFALMIILNNLGHVHSLLKQGPKSERYYQRLQTACMYMMMRQKQQRRHYAGESRSNAGGSVSAADLEVFLHNVNTGLHLIHRNSAPAA